MRILIDATPLQTGHRQRGVGTYTRELLRALLAIDRENEYRLVVHRKTQREKRGARSEEAALCGLPENASLVYLPKPRLGRLTGFVTHQVLLPALLAREEADLFHSPGFVAAFSVPGVPWRCPMPMVITLHDFIPLRIPELFNDKAINRWWYQQQRRIASRADKLICVSKATQQDAQRFMDVSAERYTVVHEGVDRQIFYPNPRGVPYSDPPFILFVGGDYPNKNRTAALAAFARLCQASTLPHVLVLVGRDDATDQELAGRYPGLDIGRVQRLDGVSQAQLAQLYRDADLFIFPSTCEGFGLPVLEAMASGTPVITSTTSSLPEVAGSAALLVDPNDPDALAAAVMQVLSDPTLHIRLRTVGLAKSAIYTWERMARQTLAIYHQVVAG